MPTFTTVALDTLLEPRVRESYGKPCDSKQFSSKPVYDYGEDKKKKEIRTLNHIYIRPALYATPEPTPIPDTSADSLSPSPYVVNNKRWGGESVSVNRRLDGFEIPSEETKREGEEGGDERDFFKPEEVLKDNFVEVEVNGDGNGCAEVEDDVVVDPQCESLRVGSCGEFRDFGKQIDNQSLMSPQAEFFDADEDFSSDGSISTVPSLGRNIESELRSARLSLFEEIERRKSAEDALSLMCSQWQRTCNSLSKAGLTFPAPPKDSLDVLLENSSIEQFTQGVAVSRFVAEAIGKGQARAEAELAAETVLELKDQEISRLRDRLQYYEAVNHEMSQRNLEIIGSARRQRQRKKSLRRWLWSGVGLSLAIGASMIAYSYLPQMSEHHPSPQTSGSSDASCICASESLLEE